MAKRGLSSGHYVATNAQRKTNQRHQNKPKKVLFSPAMEQLIVKQHEDDKWSPEIISKWNIERVNVPLVMNGFINGYGPLNTVIEKIIGV